MTTHLGVPEGRFQVISEHKPGNMIVDPDYLGDPPFRERRVPPAGVPERHDPGAEAQLLQGVVGELNTRLQLRTEDVFFNLQTVEPADWSMGSGDVPYADGVPADRLNPDGVPADFTGRTRPAPETDSVWGAGSRPLDGPASMSA